MSDDAVKGFVQKDGELVIPLKRKPYPADMTVGICREFTSRKGVWTISGYQVSSGNCFQRKAERLAQEKLGDRTPRELTYREQQERWDWIYQKTAQLREAGDDCDMDDEFLRAVPVHKDSQHLVKLCLVAD